MNEDQIQRITCMVMNSWEEGAKTAIDTLLEVFKVTADRTGLQSFTMVEITNLANKAHEIVEQKSRERSW